MVVLITGCRRTGHEAMGLMPAATPCDGSAETVTVRVLESPELGPDDPVAFKREPMLNWIVSLSVVEVVSGAFDGERLGVLVHSPSMFAVDTWGYGASPQHHPATLDLKWSPQYCLFELVRTTTPHPATREHGASFEFRVPTVPAAIVGH